MPQRIRYPKIVPEGMQPLRDLDKHVRGSGLEASLIELVYMRASQINGCAYCLDLHATDARKGGEQQRRLDVLSAWDEVDGLFTLRERAALAWTESVTLVASTHVPDAVYEETRKYFSEVELVNLTLAIGCINAWNRLAVPFRAQLPASR